MNARSIILGMILALCAAGWGSLRAAEVETRDVPLPPITKPDQGWPPAGEHFEIFEIHLGNPYSGKSSWRVTSSEAKNPRTLQHLPVPTHFIEISNPQNAQRADLLIDRWGGHDGTVEKQIRVNGHEWIQLTEPANTPERPEMYMYQDNPVVDIPLDQLNLGNNAIDARCRHLRPGGWGQWGLYSAALRLYRGPEVENAVTGSIISPQSGQTLSENPTIELKINPARPPVTGVDVFAHGYDYDYDGDGHYTEWIGAWHQPESHTMAQWINHVGTITEEPWSLTWDTTWLPDQEPGAIKLVAHIHQAWGPSYSTEIVENLTLANRK